MPTATPSPPGLGTNASEYERGLILNHSGFGSVTDDYSHGYPLKLKRQWLERWADHVEAVVQPKGAKLLR